MVTFSVYNKYNKRNMQGFISMLKYYTITVADNN